MQGMKRIVAINNLYDLFQLLYCIVIKVKTITVYDDQVMEDNIADFDTFPLNEGK